jgi:UDP-N-acetylglucosamine 2-epimerase (non-hydrolysing)
MAARPASNVISIRRGRLGAPAALDPCTTVLHAVACDDDLVEIAPVVAALDRRPSFRQIVVHAGADAGIDAAATLVRIDRRLGIADGSHAERTGAALIAFEALLLELHPQIVVAAAHDDLVVAAAMAAAKQHIAVARLGAGLRCHDWSLPDEVNRTVIDRLSDTLFTVSDDAADNLAGEGVPDGRIHFVGNTRVDVLRRLETRARALSAWERHGATAHAYTIVALQRPESIQEPKHIAHLMGALADLCRAGSVLVIEHPATRSLLEHKRAKQCSGLTTVAPAGYLESLSLLAGAGAIVTDSSAVQDDASALGVRCYTLLQHSARTTTLTHGTNTLLGSDPSAISGVRPTGCAPTPAAVPLWDGRAGERIANALAANYTLAAAYGRDH